MDNQVFEQANKEQSKFVPQVSIVKFPKEFERQWGDLIDRRFVLILLVSFTVHFLTALYFALNPPADKITQHDIKKIQERYAHFVLKTPIEEVEPEDFPVTETPIRTSKLEGVKSDGGRGISDETREMSIETKGGTAENRKVRHDAGVRDRWRTQDEISEEVSSKGLLGILTSSGVNAQGETVADLLGDDYSGDKNLDQVLSKLDGIKTAKSASERGIGGGKGAEQGTRVIKGSRNTSESRIDEIISARGSTKSTNVERKGAIVISNIAAIADETGKKSESRDPDEVSAIVNSHNSAVQYCYERELKRNPNLKGKLVIRFIIAPNGKVKDAKIISSTLNSPTVEKCVFNRIIRWDDFGSIDPAKGDAVFRQVYTFGY